MFWKWKNFLYSAFALCLCGLFAFFFYTVGVCPLSCLQGERSVFLYSPSSQGTRKTELKISELSEVRGECVFFSLLDYEEGRYALNEKTRALLAEELAEKFSAEILIKEETCGRISYYGYSKRLSGGIFVEGALINLHIAVGEEEVAVGTPIIFDGF